MDNDIIYGIINKKDVYNRKKYFKYGWSIDPRDILKYFYAQKSLPQHKRNIKRGDYILFSYNRDSREFSYASLGNEPGYIQRVYRIS